MAEVKVTDTGHIIDITDDIESLEEAIDEASRNCQDYGDYQRATAIMLITIARTLLLMIKVFVWKR